MERESMPETTIQSRMIASRLIKGTFLVGGLVLAFAAGYYARPRGSDACAQQKVVQAAMLSRLFLQAEAADGNEVKDSMAGYLAICLLQLQEIGPRSTPPDRALIDNTVKNIVATLQSSDFPARVASNAPSLYEQLPPELKAGKSLRDQLKGR